MKNVKRKKSSPDIIEILRKKFNLIAFKLEATGEITRQISSHRLFKNRKQIMSESSWKLIVVLLI